jgi:hypothetical protein
LAAKSLKVSIPYLVVLVDGILAVFWYLKEYLLCLIVFNYCPVTWHFCSEQNTNKMEKYNFIEL